MSDLLMNLRAVFDGKETEDYWLNMVVKNMKNHNKDQGDVFAEDPSGSRSVLVTRVRRDFKHSIMRHV